MPVEPFSLSTTDDVIAWLRSPGHGNAIVVHANYNALQDGLRANGIDLRRNMCHGSAHGFAGGRYDAAFYLAEPSGRIHAEISQRLVRR